MKVTEHNTIAIHGSVHPHGHTVENAGPFSLRVGIKSQPDVVRYWDTKHVLVALTQEHEEDNFTLVHVLYLRSGTKKPSFVSGITFHKAKYYRRPDEVVEVRIKKRYADVLPHPVPVGKYTGSCMYDVGGAFAVLTLQAVTLTVEPKPQTPKVIITPGDVKYGQSLAEIKKAFPGANGLEG